MSKSYTLGLCVSAAFLLAMASTTAQDFGTALNNAAQSTANSLESDMNAGVNQAIEYAQEETLGKLFPTPSLEGDIILNVILPENTTAVNLYRKAEGESDFQFVYQAWAENASAKDSKGKRLEMIDYFVEAGKKYDYKCNFRQLNDVNKTEYDPKNIGGSDSNEITIMALKGYGDFKLTNTPAVTYDQQTSRLTFTTLPKTNMSSVKLPEGLTKQPVKIVYVNPDLYSLWIYTPDDGSEPVFITLGKIDGIDTPVDTKAVMVDVTLRSDDGDGGWRLSIDKNDKSSVDGWSYEEHWYRKYTGADFGLPATIVIPKNSIQKDANTQAASTPVIDAK